MSEQGEQYEQRTKQARDDLEDKTKKVDDLKAERKGTREVLSETRKKKSRLKKDAGDFVESIHRARTDTAKKLAENAAKETQQDYMHHKEATGKMKDRLDVIPEELSQSRKEKKDARKAVENLESGATRKQEIEDSAKQWETEDKKFNKEEQELEKEATKKEKNFKKGLG